MRACAAIVLLAMIALIAPAAEAGTQTCKWRRWRLICTTTTPTPAPTPPPNSAPVISGTPSAAVLAGQAYSFTPTASDANGNSLTFSVANRPGWATFSSSTGRLSGTPTASAVGQYVDIRISVSDGQASASLSPFSVTVSQGNRPPTIGGSPPLTAREGQAYAFDRGRCGWQCADVQHHQSSFVGHLQHGQWRADRHAGNGHGRELPQRHDSRE